MRTKHRIIFILLALSIASLSACSTQAWYEGGKYGAENNCRNQPPSEIDRCFETLNTLSYAEYVKERSDNK